MLDLQPRVHLEEVERGAVAPSLEQELDRAGVAVAGGARRRDRGLAHARRAAPASRPATGSLRSPSGAAAAASTRARTRCTTCRGRRAKIWTSTWRGRSTSRSTYSVPSPNAAAPRAAPPGSRSIAASRSRDVRMPLPPPPADGFDQRRQADALDRRGDAVVGLIVGVSPGTTGTPRAAPAAAPSIFDPICAMASRRRADEDEAGVGARRRERRVLGEEAVAGMHGVGAGSARGVDDGADRQVALAARRPDRCAPRDRRRATCGARASASE